MGIGTIVSSGLGSYFNTKGAMQEREYRQQMQEREAQRAAREGQRHQAWLAELERGNKDRAESDQFYADMAKNGIEPAPQAQNVSLDQGNGVTTVPYGAAKPEALTAETMPESQVPPKSAPGAGAAVGAQPPGTGVSVEPITPAAVASRGVQPGPAKLDMPSLMDAKGKLDNMRLRAMKLKDQNAIAYLNEQGQQLIGQWAASFDGDPTANPIAYAKHIGQANAVFGKPLTMEQAAQIHNAQKAYEAEGVTEALKALHSGNRAAALKAYEKGKHRVADVQLTPAKSSAGLPSYNVTIKNADGTTETFNAFDAMMSMAGAEAQLKAFIDQQKLNNDTRKTDADVAQSKASAAASYASAANSKANANKTNVEAKLLREGVMPGKGGSDKSAELLNKYSGWFKSSLQIGDTMMSDIDPAEAAKRQAVYERAMGIAQDALSRGETPSYAAIMSQARGGGGGGTSASGSWKGWSATPK